MSILNVNTIQPIGSGTTVTVAATELKTSNFITVGTGASVTSPSANVLTLGTNTAERLRITSTGYLGLGTNNPSYLIDAHTSSGNAQLRVKSGGDLSQLILESTDTSGYSQINFADAGSNNIGMLQYFHSDNHMEFTVNGAERLRIDSDGNIGINKTPETDWNGSYRAIEIGNSSVSAYQGNTYPSIELNMNCRGTAASYSSGWKYIRSMVATQIHMPYDGKVVFRRAASGSADGDITWSESMRVTSGGHVLRPTMAAAAVTLSTGQTTLSTFNGTYQSLAIDSEGFDNANNYSTTTYRFTAPETGFYQVGCNVQLEGGVAAHTNSWMYLYPTINGNSPGTSVGGNQADFDPRDTHYYNFTYTTLLKLSQNDYVQWKYTGNLTSIKLKGQGESIFYFYQVG